MHALAERASALAARVHAHNRFAQDHAGKYRQEVATCEIARKSQSRPQLEACLALLDRAERRAQQGNQVGTAIERDAAALQQAADAHNRACPAHRVMVVRP